MPKTNPTDCICCSGKLFKRCCQPLLAGVAAAKTPVALMRSRYSAYALGRHGAYLLNTWLPERRVGLSEIELSARSINWSRLELVAKSQNGNEGLVEFNAFYLDDDFNEQVHHEKSYFQRVHGRWYYAKAL